MGTIEGDGQSPHIVVKVRIIFVQNFFIDDSEDRLEEFLVGVDPVDEEQVESIAEGHLVVAQIFDDFLNVFLEDPFKFLLLLRRHEVYLHFVGNRKAYPLFVDAQVFKQADFVEHLLVHNIAVASLLHIQFVEELQERCLTNLLDFLQVLLKLNESFFDG